MVRAPDGPQAEDLTPREWQVFELLRRGFADDQIARVLGIAEGEAARHVSSVLSKLGATREQVSISPPAGLAAPSTPAATPRPRSASNLKFMAGALVILAIAAAAAITLAFIIDSDDRATAPIGDEPALQDGAPVRPLANEDHWHATYLIIICAEEQPPIPTFAGGVHTHGDGIIHVHPSRPEEEGTGARLVKFFEYAGGELTASTLRLPGSETTYTDGSSCPDGRTASLQVSVNGSPVDDVSRYIPQDGDTILITFAP
jgi:DNA-binding CsgD family transcriptional regulator